MKVGSSERMVISVLFVTCGVLLVLFGGLDVDNAWGAIGSFLMGIGVGRLD